VAVSRLDEKVACVILHRVDEGDRYPIFGLHASFIFNLFGLRRLEFRMNESERLLSVRVLNPAPAR
jgi:hypothetical protein